MSDFKEGNLVRIKIDSEYVPDRFLGTVGTVIAATKSSCKVLVPSQGAYWLVNDDLELVS
jgi:ribosomal protein L21E